MVAWLVAAFALLISALALITTSHTLGLLPHAFDAGKLTLEIVRTLRLLVAIGHGLLRLADVLADPDYNAIIQSAPPGDESREYFVWHLRIVPRLATPAGFELGSGMAINPTLPEETAELMRRAVHGLANATGGLP